MKTPLLTFLILTVPVLSACRYTAEPANGRQACATTEPRCPTGYTCAQDGHCWKRGTSPDGGAATAPISAELRGARAASTKYQASTRIAEPGGGGVQRSRNYTFVGGVIGPVPSTKE